jgi:hypothetical protein
MIEDPGLSVSVVVPTYNRERYIGECLESILTQSHPPGQVIVVDDGSTDGTPQELSQFGSAIEVLRQPNGGKSRALNHALQHVRGSLVWIFDDDDVAERDSLAVRFSALESDPRADFVYSGHRIGCDGPDGRIVAGQVYRLPPVAEGRLPQVLAQGCFFTQQGVLARRSLYERVGPFDEEFRRGQDYEMLLRMARAGRGIGLDVPTFVFRRHEGVRGAAGHEHDSRLRDAVWMQSEHRIAQRLRERWPLQAFLGPDEAGQLDEPGVLRRALLHRMASMASKGAWQWVIEDAIAAAGQVSARPLDEVERQLCRRAATREFMQVALREHLPDFLRAARPLSRSRSGRNVLSAWAYGLLWVARHPDPERLKTWRAARAAMRVAALRLLRV